MARTDAWLAPAGSQLAPLTVRFAALLRRYLPGGVAAALAATPFAAPLRAVLSRSAEGPAWVVVSAGPLAGARMLLDMRCEKFYWLGTHERSSLLLLHREVRTGAVAWDIGAHIGYFTLALSRLVGPEGRVYAFEPLPDNLRRLRANVAASGAPNVDALGLALSDRRGLARLTRGESTLTGALDPGGDLSSTALTFTDTVDGLVARGNVPPEVMKIDVEGAEGAVLRGARETIASSRPLLVIELHSPEAAREAVVALPVRYRFYDVERGRDAGFAPGQGRYLARPEPMGTEGSCVSS